MSEILSEQQEINAPGDKSLVPKIFYHACRLLLGAVFIIASIDKLERPWDFGRAIFVYDFLRGPLVYLINLIAIIMPPLELVTGLLLIVNKWVRPAALLILAMNLMFIVAIASVMVRGMDIDCGCGLDVGIIAMLAGTQADAGAIVRDLVFLVMNLVVLLSPLSTNRKKA